MISSAPVRGLDYYTRTVFEWTTDALVRRVPCVPEDATTVWWPMGAPARRDRWAMGQERIVMLLESRFWASSAPGAVYLVLAGNGTEIAGFKLPSNWRRLAGPRIAINLGDGSFKDAVQGAV